MLLREQGHQGDGGGRHRGRHHRQRRRERRVVRRHAGTDGRPGYQMPYESYFFPNLLNTRGPYLNDVHKISGFFDPPSPLVTVTLTQLISTLVCFLGTPLPPPGADVI